MHRNVKREADHDPLPLFLAAHSEAVMRAMVLERAGTPLNLVDRLDPAPGPGEIRLRVEACAVCRTELHVIDGDLRHLKLPVIPNHEIVGIIDSVGKASRVPGSGAELASLGPDILAIVVPTALQIEKTFAISRISLTLDGGFASRVIADARFAFDLDPDTDPYHRRHCFVLA
jgi:alcohol dehydrogenase, propanol-preferring